MIDVPSCPDILDAPDHRTLSGALMRTSLLDAIGNTPLVQFAFPSTGKIFGKLEYLNPGGSVKDRSALFLVEDAEKRGILKPGGTIIDASSGNHGISLAMIGAHKGYKVIIAVSEKISKEKMDTLQAYGAQLVICPATTFIDDPRSYHSVARKLHEQTPNSFMPNQYFNVLNAQAHYSWLGPEIWQQTQGTITHFFAAAGTTGTVSGVGRYLKEQNPAIKVIAVDAATSYHATKGNPQPYKLEGIGIDFDTPVLNSSVIDEFIGITDDDAATMLKRLCRQFGCLVGPSSGAVAAGVWNYAPQLQEGDCAVMIFGDSGRAYLTKNFY